MDEPESDAPLSAEEVLTFGPVVEAQVWHPCFLQESRAPIAVAAGRPKLGRVFDEQGIGTAALIRPCVSRGRRVRGLPPIYTERMLEANASVFNGWPSFLDHAPAELQAELAKRGRSVKEIGGQVLEGKWDRSFTHPDDGQYGYRPGTVRARIWATPYVRELVAENENLLHMSINAWPTSGKPGPVPWRPAIKGMLIEGIRRQPQGSVDYVVRGGAGGRLLVQEGLEDEGAWPSVGEWDEDDLRLVVSVAERLYDAPRMADLVLPGDPNQLRAWLAEHAAHLLPALAEQSTDAEDESLIKALMKRGKTRAQAKKIVSNSAEEKTEESLSEAAVRRIIAEAQQGQPTVEEFEAQLQERTEQMLAERESARQLSEHAAKLIEHAEGIPSSWKADLRARYTVLPSGPAPALMISESECRDDEGKELTPLQVLEARVERDVQHTLDLIHEARGRPRVRGEGGAQRDEFAGRRRERAERPYWRQRFVEYGIAERESARQLSEHAAKLIEHAEGIPSSWKADLRARYTVLPSGPAPALMISESECRDDEGKELTPLQVLEARVERDVQHTLDLIHEARGRPRVRGEGGAQRDEFAGRRRERAERPYWRQRFVEYGIAESDEKALDIYGEGVTG